MGIFDRGREVLPLNWMAPMSRWVQDRSERNRQQYGEGLVEIREKVSARESTEPKAMVRAMMLPSANNLFQGTEVKTINTEYEFSVQVSELDFGNETQLSKLQSRELTITPFSTEGLTFLGVELSAESAESAVKCFEVFLTSAAPGIRIIRIDLDLVSLSQISERLDVSREAVRLWASGDRRKNFPRPFTSAGQSLLWTWSDVYQWLTLKEIGDTPRPIPTDLVESANGGYARERSTSTLGWPDRAKAR